MSQKILLKRSMVKDASGNPKLPESSIMDYGELAINYAKGSETLSIKNSNDEIITFSSDIYVDTLSSEPTETTISRLDGKPYKIGDEVRVTSSDESAINGYKFYKLYDLTNEGSKAHWAESSNGGGESSAFETCVVTLNVNTGNTTMLSGAVVTCYLEDGTLYSSQKYNGASDITFKIFPSTKYYISVSDVENFLTPSNTEIYAASYSNNRNVSMLYKTCEVNVSISGYPSESTPYAILTFNDGSDKTINVNNGGKVYIKYGIEKVSVSAYYIDNYAYSINYEYFNSGLNSITIIIAYKEARIYYITINQTLSDPYTMISSAITGNNRNVIELIRNNSHRYLGKYVESADTMYLCQLDDNDSTKFAEDGSDASLYGSRGDVFMKLPTFYYKAEKINGTNNNWKIGFSKDKVDETWKCWYGNDLIGAFEAYYDGYYLRSIKSISESTGSISWTNFRSYARNRYGSNHGKIVTWQQHSMMAFLYYAYYCNTNCKAQCGSGYSTYTKPCGQQLSMIDTTSDNGNTELGINFWGLENWWGNKHECIDNVIAPDTSTFRITTYDTSTGVDGSTRDVTAAACNGCMANMYIGEYLDATSYDKSTTSYSTGYCDGFFNYGSSYAVRRSGSNTQVANGIALAYAGEKSSKSFSDLGSRLSYVGPWEELSVSDYKALYKTGVYIQATDGTLYTSVEWDGTKTPNGIAVLTENVSVLLALTNVSSSMKMSQNYDDPLENYTTGTTDTSAAKADYNGRLNTTNIMKLNSGTSYAAGACNAFTFPDGKTKGYLPSIGEWWEIYQNKSAVDAALSRCGGTAITKETNSYYWSSTFSGLESSGYRACWMLGWSNALGRSTLDIDRYVRAVARLFI